MTCRVMLRPMSSSKVLLLLSGGLDSTILLYDLLRRGHSVSAVLFRYGQQHLVKELRCAKLHCHSLMSRPDSEFTGYTEVNVPFLGGSSLTDGIGSKVVPNRNAVLLSLAVSIAAVNRIRYVTYACNATDQRDFPDCRPDFVNAMNATIRAAELDVTVLTPFVDMTKKEIVTLGRKLDVCLEATWSCYAGGDVPCGACDACIARVEALA